MKKYDSSLIPENPKKAFWKLGSCSRTFFFLLNREFGHFKDIEEHAADPLAGGIVQMGYQCGMLWGASLAVGAESFRRHEDDHGQAIAAAITATAHVMESFSNQTGSVNCLDVTGCNWRSIPSVAKHFITGKFLNCFNLANDWAPKAFQSAAEGLSFEQTNLPDMPISCASEVAKKMGASDEEMVMVAGFAGGMGLSGHACGALGAAIWLNVLTWFRENPEMKPPMFNPKAKSTLQTFKEETQGEFLCNNIIGQNFKSIADHTEFVKNGGCEKLIEVLAR